LDALIKAKLFLGEKHEIFPLVENKELVLFVSLGEKEECSLRDIRVAVRKAFQSPFAKKINEIEIIPHNQKDSVIKAIIEEF